MPIPTRNLFSIVPLLLLVVALGACSGTRNRRKVHVVEPKPIKEGPSAQDLFVKGNSQLASKNWKAAASSFAKAAAEDPKRWDAQMNRGIALAHLAKFADALDAFDQALKHGGADKPVVYFNLGNVYQERGMYSASVDAYRASLAYEKTPNVDTLVNLGAAYVFLRQWDSANATYNYIRSLAPDDPRPLHGLGLVLQLQSKYKDAIDIYQRVHTLAPNFALSYFNEGKCLAAQKNYDQAITALNGYLRVAPKGPYATRARNLVRHYQMQLKKKK